jgi:hypothetical protein
MKVSNEKLLNFTRHLILASRKRYAEEKTGALPEFLIKRKFPSLAMPIQLPVQMQIMPEKKKPEEMPKPELKEEIFELGKITRFTLDRMIDIIECSGPEIPLKIRKESYTFLTDLSLKEDEIRNIIQKFSEVSKIPVAPIFKASARGFSMTAIISSAGSRFVLSRIKS